ncbi:Fructose-2,6-bisphosphatase [Mortierella sp. AD094]|nr:Fructose-2,6-bisphosphatase [Mortierella sp. AD094]
MTASNTNHEASIEQTSLRFLLLGDVGVGKSSFMETFISTLSHIQSNEALEEYIPVSATSFSSSTSPSPAIRLPTTQLRTNPVLQQSKDGLSSPLTDLLGLLPPKIEVPAREVTFVNLPGYSSTINPSSVLSMTDDYLNHHLRAATSIFSPSIPSSQLAWFLITGSGAHSLPTCAFYFVLYELKPVDILYMKLIHERVNLVPIITKSDTLSEKELWVLKKRMIRQLKLNGINFHTFGMSLATVEKMTELRQRGAAPFVVSSRRNQDGSLFESELQLLVNMCLYDRFRYLQEDAARKTIAWREVFGPSETPATATTEMIWNERSNSLPSPALPLDTRPTNMTQTQGPLLNAQLLSEYVVYSEASFTPPPPTPQTLTIDPTNPAVTQAPPSAGFSDGFVAGPVGYPNPVPPNHLTIGLEATGLVSPSLMAPSPFTPTTTYLPHQSGTESSAAQARLELIHQSTGMIVDSSTRPNEIMDGNNVNTVHAQLQEQHQGSYMELHEPGVKVEIPHSFATYQPSAHETMTDLNAQLTANQQQQQQQQQQQHASLIFPNGYQVPGTFTDLYQAAILPDIWEAVESGDVATVQRHLNNGASPDQRNISRSTLLHRAAWQGSQPYAVMHLLISYGANVNLTNENGNTVLQNVLMKHDDPKLIKLLLDNGAESSVPNKEGMNSLEVAALFNKMESARYLLENDISSSEPDSILNALQRAKSPDKKATKALLKSWQSKDGERKRAELMRRTGPNNSYSSQSQVNLTQGPDTNSINSVDTNKGGEGNTGSSKASSLHHEGNDEAVLTINASTLIYSNCVPTMAVFTIGAEPASTTITPSATSSQVSQNKPTSRFNIKSNIFGRKYLLWLGITTKIFNVGNYRRKLHGAHQLHGFFDPSNAEGERSRREAAVEALNDMIYWFEKEHGVVALYDATNSTRSRREMLLTECKKHNIQVMFIESICEDEALVLHNIMSVKLSSPDYKDMDPEQAVEDFKARIVHYKEAYETITEENLTYIKLINVGSQVIINHIQGYLQSRIVYYLMNLHIAPRSIFFSRHGESLYNVMGKLGGDSDLSARGKQYAKSLPLLIATHLGNSEQLTVWTSTMRRTIATAEHLTYPKLAWKALDELDAGVCDGMTYEEIEEQYPEDFANRDEDKFNYRYRGGESYRDVVLRLEPVIMELERQRNILIIGHQAILRCIYAYFMNHSHEKLPYIKIPLHTVIQLTPRAYACEEKRFKVDIEAVDTHRPKPKAGAPKAATDPNVETPVEPTASDATKQPIEDGGKDIGATITTTTMSTTTFKDSAFQRHESINRSQKSPSTNTVDPELEKAKALQSALAEATITESSANPSIALPLDDITTPGIPDAKNPNNPLEAVSTPPMTPSQNSGASPTPAMRVEGGGVPTHFEESNLSIKTKDLLTTPPMMRLRVDPQAAWQEGPEYERTAGASPRDPVISPGGRLLPKKKENYHFP